MIIATSAMTKIPRAMPMTIAAYAKSAMPLTNSSASSAGQGRQGYRQSKPIPRNTAEILIHIPALGNKTPDDNAHAEGKIDKHELLTGSELFLDGGIGHGKLNTLELVVLVRNGRLGVFFDAHGVAHGPCDTDGSEDDPRNGAQPQLRIALDANDALGVKTLNGSMVEAQYPRLGPRKQMMNAVIES